VAEGRGWFDFKNGTNEAKRLLKTKENTFSTTHKAKRSMKINGLFDQSQEVVDK
jgi:hypothetical protein